MAKTIIGLERIGEAANRALFTHRRIGLITNFSGVTSDFVKEDADVFADEGFALAKIFTPEHGLYGAGAGESVESSVHPKYGIPVISLYGDHRKPTKEDFAGLDVVAYDIQDVGLRYYTYIYTMCYAMQTAAECGIPFVVLDRPDPLGDTVEGPCMEKDWHDFTGDYELPMRYGLTPGELAGYLTDYLSLDLSLSVIRMQNYKDGDTWDKTGLPWNIPSPAIPTFASCLCYAGGCLVESVNLSEGRGTSQPFQFYGAPFIDMDALYRAMTAAGVGGEESGVILRRRSFVPSQSDYEGELCYGLEFQPRSADLKFLRTTLLLMKTVKDLCPDKFRLNDKPVGQDLLGTERLYGTADVLSFLDGTLALDALLDKALPGQQAFRKKAEPYRLYR